MLSPAAVFQRMVEVAARLLRYLQSAGISHGFLTDWPDGTGLWSMPDSGQDADVRIRIPVHWPDGRY